MLRFAAILLLLSPGAALAQSGPVGKDRPIEKGTALRYADADAGAVMAPITALFAAMAARDGAAILRQVRTEGGATTASEKPDGTRTLRHLSWSEFADRFKPGPERDEERLLDPAIEVDGDIAMVWSPYVFSVDGKANHCGTDHFDLVREGGSWKILNITWTSRACEG